MLRLRSTTAVISAIRCRCGSGRAVGPGVQAFWAVPMLQLRSTTAAISAIRCRCGSGRAVGPGVQAFWAVPMLQLRSTTAAISAIRCRCGSGRAVGPGVQAFWAVPMLQLRSTTAAISAIRCRCGCQCKASGMFADVHLLLNGPDYYCRTAARRQRDAEGRGGLHLFGIDPVALRIGLPVGVLSVGVDRGLVFLAGA